MELELSAERRKQGHHGSENYRSISGFIDRESFRFFTFLSLLFLNVH